MKHIWGFFGLVLLSLSASAFGDTDSDNDGVLDAADNCTLVANNEPGTLPDSPGVLKAQLDSDGDGFGNRCDGDFNNTGDTSDVDTTDYGVLQSVMNKPSSFSPDAANCDLNADGIVNTVDYSIFRTLINKVPGPSGLTCAGTIPCP